MHIHKLQLIIYDSRKLTSLNSLPFWEKKKALPSPSEAYLLLSDSHSGSPVCDSIASLAFAGGRLLCDKLHPGTVGTGHEGTGNSANSQQHKMWT